MNWKAFWTIFWGALATVIGAIGLLGIMEVSGASYYASWLCVVLGPVLLLSGLNDVLKGRRGKAR